MTVATDWVTISALATALGTLVLALATFASVRSANRAARVAERTLLAGLRPLLVPSRLDDPAQKVFFADQRYVRVEGGRAGFEIDEDAILMVISVRNAGAGVALLHGWRFFPERLLGADVERPDIESFTRLTRDIYVPARDVGFWQGAFRDPSAPGVRGGEGGDRGRGSADRRHPLRRPRGRPADSHPVRPAPPFRRRLARRRPAATGTSTATIRGLRLAG